jgi:hypothetical protein
MDNAKDFPDLGKAETVLALKDLIVKRITRTYEFETPTYYIMRTQLLFQNVSKYSCPIAPGEFYEKGILIDFKAYDRNRAEGVLVPSDENDKLLIKYIFLKMIEDVDKSSFDRETKLKAKKVLCFQFTNQEKYLNPDDISSVDIKQILDKEFQGPIAKGFFNSMWEDEKNMTDYLCMGLTEHLPTEYKKKYEDLQNLRIGSICSQDVRNFILRFDNYFLQLILLKSPINPNDYSTLTLETDKFRSSLKKCCRLSEELELQLDIYPLLPNQGKSTSHYMIKSSDGVEFRRRLSWRHILRPPPSFLSLREEIINPGYFDILHDSSSERCTRTLELLKISEQPTKRIDILREILVPKEEKSTSDIRAQIKENLIFLYFRSPRKEEESLCNKNHKLKISMGVVRGGVCLFHYFLMFFLFCMILLCFHWLSEIRANPVLDIPNSFWSFAFFVVAQSITVIFDYFRRNDAQRYLMRSNIKFVLILIVLVICLLLAIVVLPILI